MYYGSIKRLDVANGEGIRVSLFVSGCRNRCEGCFQPETWSFTYGKEFTEEAAQAVLAALAPAHVDGLTLLGGEPFEPENQAELAKLLARVRQVYPQKNVWCYTGYTLEQLLGTGHPHCEFTQQMLSMIDVLVDGPFRLALKDISLKFRGSANQRILDLKATLAEGRIVKYDE